jgi:hypothetical protein
MDFLQTKVFRKCFKKSRGDIRGGATVEKQYLRTSQVIQDAIPGNARRAGLGTGL